MPRPARPDDLYAFRIPTDPRLSPDGRLVAITLQTVTAVRDGYRHAIWVVAADGSTAPRQLTMGSKHDSQGRFAPDGRSLAFMSDRRLAVEDAPGAPSDREDGTQVYVLPLEGGEARRLTDLPRGVDAFEWSPDGRRLVVQSPSRGATREADARRRGRTLEARAPGEPPVSDYRYIDRLQYQFNGSGFTYDRAAWLWLVDASTGEARRLTDGRRGDGRPAWSPDGTRIAFVSDRRPDGDLHWRADVWVVEVDTGRLTRVTGGGDCYFDSPAWLPDGRTLAVLGHRYPAGAGSRQDIWLFAADGSEDRRNGGRNLSSSHDLMPGSSMNSDLTIGEAPRLAPSADGRWVVFTAPVRGSYELWRIATGHGAVERLTEGRHYISSFDALPARDEAGGQSIAYLRSDPRALPDLYLLETQGPADAPVVHVGSNGRLSDLNGPALAEIALSDPLERWWAVDEWEVQGWYLAPRARELEGNGPATQAAAAGSPATSAPVPLVTEIHGGPQSLYGWAPMWEVQVLAGAGIGAFWSNPRGSEGYGEDFAFANFRDWGEGPSRDVLAGLDELVAEGMADPLRLGLTGGSYGGYLTSWIVGHDDRFAAAITCRSVNDLAMLMVTGDIGGPMFGELQFGASPWEDPEIYREQSPMTYAASVRTPLLIQHAENDLRCTIAQAEAFFAVLRALKRPVRLMRVPGETHELTRSGTPFRRAENLVQVRSWFEHFLAHGHKGLPPLPKERAGK